MGFGNLVGIMEQARKFSEQVSLLSESETLVRILNYGVRLGSQERHPSKGGRNATAAIRLRL